LIAEKSGHWVHLDEPELVIEQIREMMTAVLSGHSCEAMMGESVSAD
jgi:hypothetical protein